MSFQTLIFVLYHLINAVVISFYLIFISANLVLVMFLKLPVCQVVLVGQISQSDYVALAFYFMLLFHLQNTKL